jgi:hypothetical protein
MDRDDRVCAAARAAAHLQQLVVEAGKAHMVSSEVGQAVTQLGRRPPRVLPTSVGNVVVAV